jgi:hypothetical protein
MSRYLSGLCVAGLGLCGGGWLIVAALAFGRQRGADAVTANLATGGGLVAICCASTAAWAMARRRRLRADGVLASGALDSAGRAAHAHALVNGVLDGVPGDGRQPGAGRSAGLLADSAELLALADSEDAWW